MWRISLVCTVKKTLTAGDKECKDGFNIQESVMYITKPVAVFCQNINGYHMLKLCRRMWKELACSTVNVYLYMIYFTQSLQQSLLSK